MTARDAIWGLIDTFCAPATEPAPEMVADERRYPRVTIWKGGAAVKAGELVVLTTYFSRMSRIMYRPFRLPRWTATFYWSDGAWASVTFDTERDLRDMLTGTAARVLGWPEAERI